MVLHWIMKPGLYLLLFLVLTVYRVVQMSVLLAKQATMDGRSFNGDSGITAGSSSRSVFASEHTSDNAQRRASFLALPVYPSQNLGAEPSPPTLAATSRAPVPQLMRENNNKVVRSRRQPQQQKLSNAQSTATCGESTEDLPVLNDPTVRLTPCLPRNVKSRLQGPNQQLMSQPIPRATATRGGSSTKKKVLWLTSFGWNQPNQTHGMTFPRSKRTRELLQAIVDHPDFDPQGWDNYHRNYRKEGGGRGIDNDASSNDNDDVQHFVFLDVETCHEGNYPTYGRHQLNQDNEGGRPSEPHRWDLKDCYTADSCPAVRSALASPLFANAAKRDSNVKLVYLDCKGNGVSDVERNLSSHIAFVSLSSHASQINRRRGDQGLPPPVDTHKFHLSPAELQQIEHCDETDRQYLLSFVGALRRDSPRSAVIALHNESASGSGSGSGPGSGVFAMSKADFAERQETNPRLTYETLLRQSAFAAAPRGTNLFSYRFSEAIAMGAIPVVHSDGWVLPFRREVVDWSQCAVVIPERKIKDTVRILSAIPAERRCRMRKACLAIHQRYMSSPAGTLRGILEGLAR